MHLVRCYSGAAPEQLASADTASVHVSAAAAAWRAARANQARRHHIRPSPPPVRQGPPHGVDLARHGGGVGQGRAALRCWRLVSVRAAALPDDDR